MEQIVFESLKGLENAEVKVTNLTSGLSFEFGGEIKIERGAFSANICFYAKIYETKHKGVIQIDDWDINDTNSFNLNGLSIPNISAFRTKITEWGLSVDKLQFSTVEEKRAIAMAMLQTEEVKRVFGKKFKVWDLLSVDEQRLLDLQFIVENFKGCGDHIKQQVATHYKIGVQPTPTPTLEEFELKLAELSK